MSERSYHGATSRSLALLMHHRLGIDRQKQMFWYILFCEILCSGPCHHTKSNPIDDHSNTSSKKVTEAEFQTIGPLYLHIQCGTSRLQTVQENILSHVILATYRKCTQIHTKCQLQYLHPPHISTSGKCHCVINNSSDNKSY